MGTCVYCGRDLEQVFAKQTSGLTLTQSLANNDAEVSEGEWQPSYWNGDMGIAKGWYIRQRPASGATEWFKDAAGLAMRVNSEAATLNTIAALAAAPIN